MVFTAAQLNEWMKQDLVWPPRRAPNQGKRPVYVYGAAQYRRVLQLIRLRREGYEDTDAVWVQLFLRGYVPPSSRVKKAVMAEYRYARARNTTIRSAYVDRLGAIPERREVSLLQELGAVDPRLGVEITPEVLIGLYRAARSPIDLEPTDLSVRCIAS
jgi:hypothetical protein